MNASIETSETSEAAVPAIDSGRSGRGGVPASCGTDRPAASRASAADRPTLSFPAAVEAEAGRAARSEALERRHATLRVRMICAAELSPSDRSAWIALERRAAEPNAYLSPHFVLPALRCFDPASEAEIAIVEGASGGNETRFVALGVFRRRGASRLFPLPHLAAWRSPHAYLSGLLLDPEGASEAIAALVAHQPAGRRPHHGLELPLCWLDGALAAAASAPASQRRGVVHHDSVGDLRAVLPVAEAEAQLAAQAGAGRMKRLAKSRRRLEQRGDLRWRWHREGGVPETVVETFLALEHAGWKGRHGTSLRASPSHEAFFREAVAGFGSEGRAIFCELLLDERPIASLTNFTSRDTGFAFKVGWDPAFKSFSPGLQNEIEFMRHAARAFPDVRWFDSGSAPSGYIDALWPSRRALATVLLPAGKLAQIAAASASQAMRLKRRLQSTQPSAIAMQAMRPELLAVASDGLAMWSERL